MTEQEDALDFNFWPSFADLMLALVLILVLVLALVAAVISFGAVDLSRVEENQSNMIKTIAAAYQKQPRSVRKDVYAISISDPNLDDVTIKNEPTLQQITFSDHVLFEPNRTDLKPRGAEILRTVGMALKQQLPLIREIQIQGHADPDSTIRYPSNTHLAALRAIEVFNFLQNEIGIDPAEYLMSATSFGEFKPVQRTAEGQYNREQLRADNLTPELKGRNRRIELLLFYRL